MEITKDLRNNKEELLSYFTTDELKTGGFTAQDFAGGGVSFEDADKVFSYKELVVHSL